MIHLKKLLKIIYFSNCDKNVLINSYDYLLGLKLCFIMLKFHLKNFKDKNHEYI